MTQGPQQPPLEPQEPDDSGDAPRDGAQQPAHYPAQPQQSAVPPATPGQPAAPQPQWGQYGQPQQAVLPQQGQPQYPAAPQQGQPPVQQPQWGQPGQPGQQPQWGQPQYGQQQPPQYPGQPQWGQYGQPQQPSYGQPAYGQQPQYGQPGYGGYIAPPKPGVIPLRPLGLGEILDGAFQTARRNGKAMFGSALIFQLATAAVSILVMFLTLGSFMTDMISLGGTFDESDPAAAEALGGSIIVYALTMLITAFVSVLIQMVLQGALVVPVLRATLNRKTTFGLMWRLAKPRIGSLIILALLYAAAFLVAILVFTGIVVGLIFALGANSSDSAILGVVGLSFLLALPFAVVAIWISTKLLVAPAAVVVENIGAIQGIKRSWQLTRSNWWRTFGISLLAAVIAGVIGSIITTPVSFLAGFLAPVLAGGEPTANQAVSVMLATQAISMTIAALVGAVTLAFQTGVMALIYVDLRMRRDGFDITLLKESESAKDDGGIPGSPVPAGFLPGAGATGTAPGSYGG